MKWASLPLLVLVLFLSLCDRGLSRRRPPLGRTDKE